MVKPQWLYDKEAADKRIKELEKLYRQKSKYAEYQASENRKYLKINKELEAALRICKEKSETPHGVRGIKGIVEKALKGGD